MSEINKINLTLLKSYYQDFVNEQDHFTQFSLRTFLSCYLKNCQDTYVLKMANNLDSFYSTIKNGYHSINDWWSDYNSNLEGLERSLSNSSKSGHIQEGLLRNYINTQLPELRDYHFDLSSIKSVVGNVKNPTFINNGNVYDVNFDGVISPADFLLIKRFANGIETPTTFQKDLADVNQDGYVTLDDASILKSYILGNIDEIPLKQPTNINVEQSSDNKFKDWLSDAVKNVENLYNKTRAFVSQTVGSFFDKVESFFTSVSEQKIEETNTTPIFKLYEDMYNQIIDYLIEGGFYVPKEYDGPYAELLRKADIANAIMRSDLHVPEESFLDKASSWVGNAIDDVGDFFNETGAFISDGFSAIGNGIVDIFDDVKSWFVEDAIPWLEKAAKTVAEALEGVAATVGTFVLSLTEGILEFGETILDFVVEVGAVAASAFTGIYDGIQAIYGGITGNEWSSVTKAMWDNTMAFVSEKYVEGWFDSLYEDTSFGKWLAEKSYGFETVRSIGSGLGYVAGVVLLTIATFGVGGVATTGGALTFKTAAVAASSKTYIIAGLAGFSRGTEDAWSDGADLFEGLGVGISTGVWEGLQYHVGYKINNFVPFGKGGIFESVLGGSGTSVNVLNSLSRMLLDGVDSALEGFAQPLIQTIYKDGYYDETGQYIEFDDDMNILQRYVEMFDDSGGWSSVGTNAAIGLAGSAIGEGFDLRKYFKDSQATLNINISERDLQVKIDKYNKLLEMANSQEYLDYIKKDIKNNPKFDKIDVELKKLQNEFATILKNNNYSSFDSVDPDSIKRSLEKINNAKKFTNKQEIEGYYPRNTSTTADTYVAIEGPIVGAYLRGTDCTFTTTNGQSVIYHGSDINKIKREFELASKQIGQSYNNIDQFIAEMDYHIEHGVRLTEDTVLYRGVNSLFFDGKQLELGDLKAGDLINDKAFTSTSMIESDCYNQNNIVLEILAPEGTKGTYLGKGASELLLERDTTFRVLSDHVRKIGDNKYKITVEIVPKEEIQKLTLMQNLFNLLENTNGKNAVKSVLDEINLNENNQIISKYNDLFNKNSKGIDINDFYNDLNENGLIDKFYNSISDIDKLYARGQVGVVEHGIEHVERVMLYSMHMGKQLNLSDYDMNLLIEAAKYHDIGVYNGHKNHSMLSAQEVYQNLSSKYPTSELNKIAAIVEYHELPELSKQFENILSENNISLSRNNKLSNVLNSIDSASKAKVERLLKNISADVDLNTIDVYDCKLIFDSIDDRQYFNLMTKYHIPIGEQLGVRNIANILKDADAIDRTRFMKNLDTSYFRNKEVADNLVKTSYQMQEIHAKVSLDDIIQKNSDLNTIQLINKYRNLNVPDYVIYFSLKTWNLWKVGYSSVESMIETWMK